MDPEKLFLENLPLIERVTAAVCRRHACWGAEADDFASRVKLKLIEDDYAVLRKFGGRSSLKTYLTTVVVNLFRDVRIEKWGKWRPSAGAKKLGVVAMQLEQLLYRDERPFEEAVEILRRNFGVETSLAELTELAGKLRPRMPRHFENEAELDALPGEESAASRVDAEERADLRRRVEAELERVLSGLEPEERLILRLRFVDGHTVARLARVLDCEQRPLYSRIDRLRRDLRGQLETAGVSAASTAEILGAD